MCSCYYGPVFRALADPDSAIASYIANWRSEARKVTPDESPTSSIKRAASIVRFDQKEGYNLRYELFHFSKTWHFEGNVQDTRSSYLFLAGSPVVTGQSEKFLEFSTRRSLSLPPPTIDEIVAKLEETLNNDEESLRVAAFLEQRARADQLEFLVLWCRRRVMSVVTCLCCESDTQ
jgi:hypothetical protein